MGQGSNPWHSINPSHYSDSARSFNLLHRERTSNSFCFEKNAVYKMLKGFSGCSKRHESGVFPGSRRGDRTLPSSHPKVEIQVKFSLRKKGEFF